MMQFSEQTLARFAREVAKYPAEQKVSAVMACLAIVQHEQGYVSPEAEAAIGIAREFHHALAERNDTALAGRH